MKACITVVLLLLIYLFIWACVKPSIPGKIAVVSEALFQQINMTKHREQSVERILEVTLIEKKKIIKGKGLIKHCTEKSNGPKKLNDKSAAELGRGI